MKKPTTKQELINAIRKLEKANEKWYDTERLAQINKYKKELLKLENNEKG